MSVTDAEFEARMMANEDLVVRLYSQISDLKASLGCLVALMQEDIDGGKVRATNTRQFLLADARNLSRYEAPLTAPAAVTARRES